MFCANCGAQLAEGVRFCPDCGTSVGTAASTAVGQVQPTAPAASPGMGEYVDRWTGFALDRPPGWMTRVTNGVITVLQDAAGLVGAFFWPVRVPETVPPITIAQQFVSICSGGNPTFKAWLAGQQRSSCGPRLSLPAGS